MVFNVAWLVCILGGSAIAVPVAIAVIAVHLRFFSTSSEIALIAAVTVIGVLVDSLFLRTGILISPDGSFWPPLWLVSLWALFATTLNHSLRWFHTRLPWAILIGGVAGMMTYLAVTRLTDFSLKQPLPLTMAMIMVAWWVIFPVCLFLCRKWPHDQSGTQSGDQSGFE